MASPVRTRGTSLLTAAAFVGLAVLPANLSSSVSEAHASEHQGSTLTIAVVDPTVDSLNPFTSIYALPTQIHGLIYDYLTMYTAEDATPTAGLAEDWQHSDDGLTWTYQIREGTTFSDGEPVTAEDVAFTFNTILNDETGAMANANYVESFESVTAVDEYTVEVTLSEPQATMETLDIPIVPQHVWENVDNIAKFSNEDEHPIVGSGPWILTDYNRNESITLEANEDYWRGAPGFDTLIYRFYKDQDAAVEALRKGEVSVFADLTSLQAEALQNEDTVAVNVAVGKRFVALTINPGAEAQNGEPIGNGHPALQDQIVRTAILHAIDRDALTDRVYGGYFDPSGSYIPTRYETYHWEPEGDEVIAYDPDEANRILDAAGYEMGDDGVRVSPAGDRLVFRQFVHADDPARRQIAQFMEEWLAEIGIEVTTEPSDDIGGILDSGEYDLLFTGWTVNPDPDYILSIQTCWTRPEEPGAPYQNDSYFCNERYDELYAAQHTEIDPERRAEIVQEMQQILYETGVVIIFGYPDMLEAYRTDVIEEGSMLTQPAENGNIYGQDGYWSWWSAQPATEASAEGGDGSTSNTPWLVIGIGALVVVGAGLLLMRRRAATAEERE